MIIICFNLILTSTLALSLRGMKFEISYVYYQYLGCSWVTYWRNKLGIKKRKRKRIILITLSFFDGNQGTALKDLVQVPIGPVTRARAKKFKDVLNRLIQELWAQANLWRPIEHDPRGQQRIVTLIQVLEGSGQG
jgi:hypothetical protein